MRAISLTLIVLGTGCAPSLSTFQPAHVPQRGHVAVAAAIESGVAVGPILTLYQTAKDLSSRARMGEPITDDDKWRIFDAGVNLLLATPSIGPLFSLGYTPLDRLELDVRYSGSAWRLGGRYQLLDHTTGPFDMTLGLGASRFSFTFPLSDQIPGLELKDFSRWQLDMGLLMGTSRNFMRVWIGPKAMLTTFETELDLTLAGDQTLARFEGRAAFIGGQGGIALGYKHLFLAFELTLTQLVGTAHLTSPVLNPDTRDTNMSAFVVFPTLGLMGEI